MNIKELMAELKELDPETREARPINQILFVDITKADIEEADRSRKAFDDAVQAQQSATFSLSAECPVAQAIKRITGLRSVYVQGRWISIEGIPFLLSERGRRWVAKYDKRERNTPARFQIKETTFEALRS